MLFSVLFNIAPPTEGPGQNSTASEFSVCGVSNGKSLSIPILIIRIIALALMPNSAASASILNFFSEWRNDIISRHDGIYPILPGQISGYQQNWTELLLCPGGQRKPQLDLFICNQVGLEQISCFIKTKPICVIVFIFAVYIKFPCEV